MSSNLVELARRSVTFYALGGTGIDLLRAYREGDKLNQNRKDIYADEVDVYIDSSDSNLSGVAKEQVYRLKNLDGGGKDRELVKKAIAPAIPDLLIKHPAGDLAVITAGISGGTGSGCLPYLAGSLVKAGKSVVCVVIADHTSSKSIANTINTIADLESISAQLGKCITIIYSKNDPTKTLADNDAYSLFAMSALSILGSGKCQKPLDREDIKNLFNFSNVTHHQPQLAQMHIVTSGADLAELGHLAAMGALLRSENTVLPAVETDYDAVGYLQTLNASYDCDFFYAITPSMNDIKDDLVKSRDTITMKRKVAVQQTLIGNDDEFDGNTGVTIF